MADSGDQVIMIVASSVRVIPGYIQTSCYTTSYMACFFFPLMTNSTVEWLIYCLKEFHSLLIFSCLSFGGKKWCGHWIFTKCWLALIFENPNTGYLNLKCFLVTIRNMQDHLEWCRLELNINTVCAQLTKSPKNQPRPFFLEFYLVDSINFFGSTLIYCKEIETGVTTHNKGNINHLAKIEGTLRKIKSTLLRSMLKLHP